MKNYQKRAKSKITGILSASERSNLLAAAKTYEDEFGWTIVTDPSTGARLGLPAKLVPQVRDAARGTRWSAAHGEVQVETFRIPESEIKLAALFEQQKKEPASRKVESSALRDDGFTISGMQGLKKFSVRAQRRDGEIRGLIMLFDQMMETIVAGVSPAIVSAFSPFPERSMPFAAMAKPVEYGNGLIVSSRGHIVTDRKLASGCQVIVAAGWATPSGSPKILTVGLLCCVCMARATSRRWHWRLMHQRKATSPWSEFLIRRSKTAPRS